MVALTCASLLISQDSNEKNGTDFKHDFDFQRCLPPLFVLCSYLRRLNGLQMFLQIGRKRETALDLLDGLYLKATSGGNTTFILRERETGQTTVNKGSKG